MERCCAKLQEFDPAGIGARSLQECLLLQIARRDDSRLKTLMQRVVTDYYDEFTKKHWDKIQSALKLSDLQTEALRGELRKLNPKPGASMGEAVGRSMQQITPDFIVDTLDDGTVTFTLNQGDLPELQVSQSFADSMKEYQQNPEHMSRQTKEALLYIKKKVDAAQGFIEAIRVRRHTLTVTMQAIITLQHQFFVDGDEASLRPMILKDVAERTGLDLSTISRVSNSKYAQTRWGTFPLRYFFSDGYVTENGEELSTRQIKAALRDIINAEDKRKPLSDDALTRLLAEQGFPIARRTVAKYREQLGIPVARLRKMKRDKMRRKANHLLTARVVSMVFTPFYLPLLGLIALFFLSYLRYYDPSFKFQVLAVVYFFTILLPTVLIHLYRKYQGWTLIELGRKERRMVPYVISILCYFTCVYIMELLHIPHFMASIVIAALVVQMVCALINVWWKISTHTAAIGGVAGALFVFCRGLRIQPRLVVLPGAHRGRHAGHQPHDSAPALAGAGGGRLLRRLCLRHLGIIYLNEKTKYHKKKKYETSSKHHHGQHQRPARHGESLQAARRAAGTV